MKKTEVLLVSSLCSAVTYEKIRKLRTKQSLDPVRRVFEALIDGLSKEKVNVTCISALPLSPQNTELKVIPRDEEDCIAKYIYLGFRNTIVTRMVDLHKNAHKEVKSWIKRTCGSQRYIICDSLILMCSMPARKLGQKHSIKTIAYVTDYPSMATKIKGAQNPIKWIFQKLFDYCADKDLRKFDGYVLVAEPLKELIGKKCSEYIVVEDIINAPVNEPKKEITKEKQIIVYGGALCSRFGVNKLVDAITMIEDINLEMHFYGSGESVSYIVDMQKKDSRIKYCGNVSFEEMVVIQIQADLLVNPRPSDESFVRYSFPSKILSYLICKTPVLCTRLPGISEDYCNLMYWFDDESPNAMAKRIQEVLSTPYEARKQMSEKAYEYVVENKNGKVQANRIINFLKIL